MMPVVKLLKVLCHLVLAVLAFRWVCSGAEPKMAAAAAAWAGTVQTVCCGSCDKAAGENWGACPGSGFSCGRVTVLQILLLGGNATVYQDLQPQQGNHPFSVGEKNLSICRHLLSRISCFQKASRLTSVSVDNREVSRMAVILAWWVTLLSRQHFCQGQSGQCMMED